SARNGPEAAAGAACRQSPAWRLSPNHRRRRNQPPNPQTGVTPSSQPCRPRLGHCLIRRLAIMYELVRAESTGRSAMKTSIATVSISGDFREKLAAIAGAGFDGVEIFETDFLAFDGTPGEVGSMVRD